jgi:uncharacterized tellurite resistance protein B-like protein
VSLTNLLSRFKETFSQPATSAPVRHDPLRLATPAVLLEIGYADGTFTPDEGNDLAGYLQRAFSLETDEAAELIEAAAEIRASTIDHFALTNFIRKSASLEERIEIVKTMWRMVYSDGRLDEYENYLVRKLADLLGLEHRVMIDAKSAVLDERGRQ